jgi:XTP/dITP diphosphohydrolase
VENLCITSTYGYKIHELELILGDTFKHYSLRDFGSLPEAEEPFDSFLKNAEAKAKHYGQFTKMLTLSEDAGLSIHSLWNFSGVHSKHFTGENGGLRNAFNRLEKMLSTKKDHRAGFSCVSMIYDPQKG